MSFMRVSGHFGEWLQGRLGPKGPVVLVTVACSALAVEADGKVSDRFQQDSCGILAMDRARRLLRELGGPPDLRVMLTAQMPPGGGAGVSTASLLALAGVCGFQASPEKLARACLVAEGAVDPLMLDAPDACLWAPRRAQVERFFGPLPAFDIVGGFWGEPLRTVAEDLSFGDISDLVGLWAAAVACGDRSELAAVASEAAARTTRLRGPYGDPTSELAKDYRALGHFRAHTGSARGLIFAPGGVPDGLEARLAAKGYAHVLRFSTGGVP